MHLRAFVLCLLVASALGAGGKKEPARGRGESESTAVWATAYADKDSVKELLGTDLGGDYVVLDVKVTSRFGKEIEVRRDDFLLRTDKDGQRSTPFEASQIAGRGALVVRETGVGGGAAVENPGPVWGGVPGTLGMPGTLGGPGAVGGGGGSGGTAAQTTMEQGKDAGVPPLQKMLQAKILPEKKTDKSLTGLLYFPLGKQKPKDLELIYKASDGKISLRFKQ
jgi:hypothetical protein